LSSSGDIGRYRAHALVNLLAVYSYILRRRESKTHVRSLYTEHGDGNFIANPHRLSDASGQNEHPMPPGIPFWLRDVLVSALTRAAALSLGC
jgi:hypothetical protein